GTGFCPPAPINQSSNFLLSPSVRQNLELIASVPNSGISHVRTHWILQLIDIKSSEKSQAFLFQNLDKYLSILHGNHLIPHIEFMGNPGGIFSNKSSVEKKAVWRETAFEAANHFIKRFGLKYVNKFRFETWNEPDLHNYNILNLTKAEFIDYVTSIRSGLAEIAENVPGFKFKLRGPAGLFHKRELHQFCYGILEYCTNTCPIDILTYHRKGQGESKEILRGGIELIRNLTKEFPWIAQMEVSNNEADLKSGWSHPLPMNSDVRYAAKLVETVFLHWDAKIRGVLKNLETISHDNAFLSYHPYEFSQRTLLAHFRMNNSRPIYSEFIKKPVLGALGLLANLGNKFLSMERRQNISYISTVSQDSGFFGNILAVSTRNLPEKSFKFTIKLPPGKNVTAFVEILDQKRTNPARYWKKNSSPPYPGQRILQGMRRIQTQKVLVSPEFLNSSEFSRIFKISSPFVISLRFCEESLKNPPQKVENLRFNILSRERITILWNDNYLPSRCLKNYQVFFKAKNRRGLWKEITQGWHVPDLSFDFWRPSGVSGIYKVRSVDILGRRGKFSKPVIVKSASLFAR
ncbi:alpha-L-iduronidase, partial [Phlebotomus papatasi]|uniref:alpha-L-iduronidase n=1 Tax=Phlebotomus papatasi TaxID=29031 RepID=UPI0024833B39